MSKEYRKITPTDIVSMGDDGRAQIWRVQRLTGEGAVYDQFGPEEATQILFPNSAGVEMNIAASDSDIPEGLSREVVLGATRDEVKTAYQNTGRDVIFN